MKESIIQMNLEQATGILETSKKAYAIVIPHGKENNIPKVYLVMCRSADILHRELTKMGLGETTESMKLKLEQALENEHHLLITREGETPRVAIMKGDRFKNFMEMGTKGKGDYILRVIEPQWNRGGTETRTLN